MAVPTTAWDESSPANTDNISQGDDRIREMKTQIREVIDVDHDFPSSGNATDVGQHKQVTLQEQADLGTGAVSATILGSQTVSGKGELVYTDEDDNDVQITSGGSIRAESISGVYPAADAASVANILGYVYPVGCIYTNITGTNPNTELGFGTWTAFGAGRVIVGYDSGDTDFDTAEETGGSKTHTLTSDEMPAHTHTYRTIDGAGAGGSTAANGDSSGTTNDYNTSSTGGGSAHNNVQPYIVAHFWKRTA